MSTNTTPEPSAGAVRAAEEIMETLFGPKWQGRKDCIEAAEIIDRETGAGRLADVDCSALMIALKDYIDARIEEEFAGREEGADGYRQTAFNERKEREAAWERVARLSTPPLPHTNQSIKHHEDPPKQAGRNRCAQGIPGGG